MPPAPALGDHVPRWAIRIWWATSAAILILAAIHIAIFISQDLFFFSPIWSVIVLLIFSGAPLASIWLSRRQARAHLIKKRYPQARNALLLPAVMLAWQIAPIAFILLRAALR